MVDDPVDRSFGRRAELGRLLAAAEGYLVLSKDGRHVGSIDHVRYGKHSEYPDEIVVRRRFAARRRRQVIPFDAIESVSRRERIVVLRIDHTAAEQL